MIITVNSYNFLAIIPLMLIVSIIVVFWRLKNMLSFIMANSFEIKHWVKHSHVLDSIGECVFFENLINKDFCFKSLKELVYSATRCFQSSCVVAKHIQQRYAFLFFAL